MEERGEVKNKTLKQKWMVIFSRPVSIKGRWVGWWLMVILAIHKMLYFSATKFLYFLYLLNS